MDGVETGNCLDDLYEMDCPKFVDFTVPQDMNDNADEWFNVDHENGIPLTYEETPATKETPAPVQLPQDVTEDVHSEDDATEPESSEPDVAVSEEENMPTSQSEDLSSSGPETNETSTDSTAYKPAVPSPRNAVCQVSDNHVAVEESSEPELSESEEMKMSSMSDDVSPTEMSTDSLEINNTAVSVGKETMDATKSKHTTCGSPEMVIPKRRGNIVTSFSHRDDDSVHNQSSKPEQKKPHSKQQSIVAPRPKRKSSRLQTRRSADPARAKRNSLSQATKRRSANPIFSRPRSGIVDPPNNKRRKVGNDDSTAVGESYGKKLCPKLKGKVHLTIPSTPSLLRRNVAKVNTQIKSTEELEMDRIAHFRQELAAIRKKSAQSFKAVKVSGPIMPSHATIQSTKPEEFKFETDARIKSHTMETRKDARTKDFVGNLRKYVPSPSKHQGPTRPKPFQFADSRKRTHENSFDAEKKGYEFRSTALAVSQFQTKTPERFRSKPISEQNKGPEPAIDRPKKPKLTHPMTPALESRNRHRPVTAVSQAQREEQELAEMRNYKFKAQPVDPRVMSNVSIGVKTANHKEPTKPIGFDLEIEKRLLEREPKKEQTEEHYEFRARPLPAKILAGPVGIAEVKHVPTTVPKSPAFALKNRVKVYEGKEREKEKEPEHDNFHIIKARPILHVGVPFMPNMQHKRTEPEPFSFDEKIQESKARKEAKKLEILKVEEKARKFRAQPLPDPSCSGLPDKRVKSPTQVAPFSLADKGAKQAEEWSKKMEEEIRECKRIANAFKAKPATILYEEPFVPEKSGKPMTDISNFTLNTERRAEERKGYEQHKYDRQCMLDTALAQREAEREEEMQREISKQRAEAVHRANPVRYYKTVAILPSTKAPTQPKTPNFSDRTRKNSHV